MVLSNFKEMKLKTMQGEKLNFEWNQVKGFIHGALKITSLITSGNIAFGKLLIPILSTLNKTGLSVKKFFGPYHEPLQQNRSGVGKNLIRLPAKREKMNNLKQIYTSN